MSESVQTEIPMKASARKIYIHMLRQRCDAIDTSKAEDRELSLWAELIRAGHLDGAVIENANGLPSSCTIMGPTVQGRLFLQELEEKEKAESLWGKFKKHGLPILTFFGGILSAVFIEWLKKQLKLSP